MTNTLHLGNAQIAVKMPGFKGLKKSCKDPLLLTVPESATIRKGRNNRKIIAQKSSIGTKAKYFASVKLDVSGSTCCLHHILIKLPADKLLVPRQISHILLTLSSSQHLLATL